MSPGTWRAIGAGAVACGAVSGAAGLVAAPGWWVGIGLVVGAAVMLAWAALEDLTARRRALDSLDVAADLDHVQLVTWAFLLSKDPGTDLIGWRIRDVTDEHLVAKDPAGAFWQVPYTVVQVGADTTVAFGVGRPVPGDES